MTIIPDNVLRAYGFAIAFTRHLIEIRAYDVQFQSGHRYLTEWILDHIDALKTAYRRIKEYEELARDNGVLAELIDSQPAIPAILTSEERTWISEWRSGMDSLIKDLPRTYAELTAIPPARIMAACDHKAKCIKWLGFAACSDCAEQAKLAEIATREPTAAESAMLACDHEDKRFYHDALRACPTCACIAMKAAKDARKAQLAAERANRYNCARCGIKPYSYTVGNYPLCTPCKKLTMQEHNIAASKAGILAMTAREPLCDKSNWACSKFDSLKEWAADQEKQNPNVTM